MSGTKNIFRDVLLPVLAIATLFSVTGVTAKTAQAQFALAKRLEIGDKAPELDVSDWVTDGDGSFPKVTRFEEGQVYVVEFWATWCQPCIMMMPEMARLQSKYGDKVRFLSITEETPDEVLMLKERDYPGQPGTPFKKYMNQYCVGADPDGSTHTSFLGLGSSGIPHAFIVGPTGEIEWADHPGAIEPVLGQIVDGSWDREKYYADQKAIASLNQRIGKALQTNDYAAAFDLAGELVPHYAEEDQLALRFKRALLAMRLPAKEGSAYIKETLGLFAKEEGAVAALVWKVVELKNNRVEIADEILQEAQAVIDAEVKTMPDDTDEQRMTKGATIDTQAHLLFVTRQLDEAIAAQEQAAQLLDEKEITDFLKFLKTRKAALVNKQEEEKAGS